ncbi:hypothetical protein GQ53DRAFT_837065 [Thozetella sp. PMI_491]|nr:hypothetical protein GQ53DRAFT_837065 [Thozetella sp. PMI_491]
MLLLSATAFAAAIGGAVAQFDWAAIEPTKDLRYHDCYGGFKCARLKVPLDWNHPNDRRTVAIAITTLPAKVPIDHPDFGGTIFTNPGGPGGSGVSFIQGYGAILQSVVDKNKKYEILSWDPRGVGHTTPRVDCFNDTLAEDAWMMERRGLGWSGAGSEEGLKRHFALFKARGSLCENTLRGSDILKHVSTAAVCRDMVEMADRNDELRKKQLAQIPRAGSDNSQHPLTAGQEPQPEEVVRVQYMGFSYGTVLGNTFASMFPGRVGRVMIDGVVDVGNYMDGLWTRNLMDTEAIVQLFYDSCFEEGSERCPIKAPTDKSSADIKKRIDKLTADLEAAPVPFVQDTNILFVSGDDIRAAFKIALYNPLAFFPILATILAQALEGNYWRLFLYNTELPVLENACRGETQGNGLSLDATGAIACSDILADISTRPYEFYRDIAVELKNQSPTFGPWWTDIPLQCVGMHSPGGWRFVGPWTTPPADPSLKEGVPAAPLLILSTRLDPVTPMVNANLMSAGHPGSAVVVQQGAGHCVVASTWSECVNEIVRDFFEHGTVPKNGTVCQSNCRPWNKEECGPLGRRANALADSTLGNWFDGRLPLGI